MSEASTALLNRVRGLLAKAEDPAATPAEAEAFSAKAEELIAKYAIDTALLEAKEHSGKPTKRAYASPEPYGRAKANLLGGIAGAHGCTVIRNRHTRFGETTTTLFVFGFESDLDLVDLLYTSLLLQGTNALLHQARSDRSFRTSYWYAFAARVSQRIRQARAKATSESGTPGTALVLADRSREVAQAVQDEYGKVKNAARGRATSGEGWKAGEAAADRANLNQRGLGGNRRALSR